MGEMLQRWRCPDCLSVFDVFVNEHTGRATLMKDELCPTCHARGKFALGSPDERETAFYNGGEAA